MSSNDDKTTADLVEKSDVKASTAAVEPTAKKSATATATATVRPRPRKEEVAVPFKLSVILTSLLLIIGVGTSYLTSDVDRFDSFMDYVTNVKLHQVPTEFQHLMFNKVPAVGTRAVERVQGRIASLVGPEPPLRDVSLNTFIDKEVRIAWHRLLDNIHPEGTEPGCVVASPSRDKPNYWYQWTRDSALVMNTIVTQFTKTGHFRDLVNDYVGATQKMQHVQTTIGGFEDGGLGDVKYEVDGSPFTGEWGRPQNDGPALRVITLTKFARHLLQNGTDSDKEFVRTTLYDSALPTKSIIKGDLEHIAHRWREPGFDLWEEVSGQHFYTLMAIHRALEVGSALAIALGDQGAAVFYSAEAVHVQSAIDEFWSEDKGIIRVTLNHSTGRESEENAHKGDAMYGKASELDVAVLLAVLHSGRGTAWELDNRVFATLDRLIKAFEPLYPINKGLAAPALGRYPEDQYDGVGLSEGHAWYLCTLSAAEVLYRSSHLLTKYRRPIHVSPQSRAWYSRFTTLPGGDPSQDGSKDSVTIPARSREMRAIVSGQRRLADQFMSVVQAHVRTNGSMNEQFHRTTGEGRGARDLTWSYAAFITATQGRYGS